MGTRGFVGFVVDDQEKIAYNHSDSYPSGLGSDVLGWLYSASRDVDAMREQVRNLRVVDPSSRATDEDVQRLRAFANERVSTRDLHDWYVLLHSTQGDPAAMLRAGVIEDAHSFPADSLMCENGYLVDLDSERFEAYVGFQKEPHTVGRFANRPIEDYTEGIGPYYPVRLVASWSLTGLPSQDTFLAELGEG